MEYAHTAVRFDTYTSVRSVDTATWDSGPIVVTLATLHTPAARVPLCRPKGPTANHVESSTTSRSDRPHPVATHMSVNVVADTAESVLDAGISFRSDDVQIANRLRPAGDTTNL